MNEDRFTLFLPPPQSEDPGVIVVMDVKNQFKDLIKSLVLPNLEILESDEDELILRNENTGEEFRGIDEIGKFLDESGIDSSLIIKIKT
ncbi:hypothetical protein ACFL24_00855 [Patescibacteria group bacterium]